MGLAQAEQKEVREREEGGSRGSGGSLACSGGQAGGGQRADNQADWLAGWGRGAFGWAGSQGQDYSRLLAGEEATWQPSSLSLSLRTSLSLSISLSFVVRRQPSGLSRPSQPSLHISPARCLPLSASTRPLLPPPASLPACLWAPASAHLLFPSVLPPSPPAKCLCLSVCLPEGPVRRGWESSPCSLPSRDQRCCRMGEEEASPSEMIGCCLGCPHCLT